jgi:hypothetical protein
MSKEIIESDAFKSAIKEAIENSSETDYYWNGEEEISTDYFDKEQCFIYVMNAIKQHLLETKP